MKWFIRYTYTERGGAGLGGNSTEKGYVALKATTAEEAVAEAQQVWEDEKKKAANEWSKQNLRDAELVWRLPP